VRRSTSAHREKLGVFVAKREMSVLTDCTQEIMNDNYSTSYRYVVDDETSEKFKLLYSHCPRPVLSEPGLRFTTTGINLA